MFSGSWAKKGLSGLLGVKENSRSSISTTSWSDWMGWIAQEERWVVLPKLGRTVSFPARLQKFWIGNLMLHFPCESGTVVICLPLTMSLFKAESPLFIQFLKQWGSNFHCYLCCLNQCSWVGKGPNSPLSYKQYTLLAHNDFQEIPKQLELLIITHLLKERTEAKWFPGGRRICFALLFVLQPKEFCGILQDLSGAVGVVVCWCSCSCYSYLLYGDFKKLSAELEGRILFCSSLRWSWYAPIHELPFWSETSHEYYKTYTYYKTYAFACELSCTVMFGSIWQLTCCPSTVFSSSGHVPCDFYCIVFQLKLLGQHSDLLFKQIRYL